MDSHDKDIKNNAWVTMNNDFFGHEWGDLAIIFTSDEVTSEKSLANHLTSDQNIVIHGNECIILFLTRYFMSWAHNFARQKQSSIVRFVIVVKEGLFCLSIVTSLQLICDVTRTRDTSIVTSYSSIVLARANWRKGDLH